MEAITGLPEVVADLVHIIGLLEAHHLELQDLHLVEVHHLEQLDLQVQEVQAEVLEEAHHLEEEEIKISITF